MTFLMFSTPIVMGVVVGIVTERQLKLLEWMKMAGMSENIYFLSWFLASMGTAMVGLIVLLIALIILSPIVDSR